MKKRRKGKTKERDRRRESTLPELLGEAALLLTVVAVPLAINRGSSNVADVKDAVLGLGVALGLALWLMAGLARGRLGWVSSRLNLLVLAFAAWAGASALYSRHWYITVSEFGKLAAHVGLYVLVVVSLRSFAQVRRVIGAACLAAVPVCIYGFVQAAGLDPVEWSAGKSRVFSLLANATYLASFLILIAPVAVAVGWPSPKEGEAGADSPREGGGPVVSGLFLAAAAMMALCLYFSVTISPMIGLVLGLCVVGAMAVARGGWRAVRRSWVWLLVGVVVAGGLAPVGYRYLPERQKRRVNDVLHFRDPSGRERVLQWRIALDLFQERPALGLGYGTFKAHSLGRMSESWYTDLNKSAQKMLVPSYAHNEYLQVLAGTGVIGAALFLLLLGGVSTAAVRVSLRHSDHRWRRIGLGITAAVMAFLVQNFFGVTFRQTGAVTFFWLWVAVLAVAAAWLPGAGGATTLPRRREFQFRPVARLPLAGVGAGLVLLLTLLGWAALRPVKASMLVRSAEKQARTGQAASADSAELGRQYFREGAALAEEALRLSPYSQRGCYLAAYLWGELGEYDKALAANERALELLPDNASAEYNLGVTYLKLDKVEEAEAHLRRAVELMPTSFRNQGALADVLLREDRVEEAAEHAQRAVQLAPKEVECRTLMADVEGRRGNLPERLKQLRAASRLSPDDPRIWRDIAILLLAMNKHGQAITASRTWARVDPRSAEAYQALGEAYYRQKRYEAARRALSEALARDDGYAPARLYLAIIDLRQGDIQSAKKKLQRVAREDPGGRVGEKAKEILGQL